MSNLHESCDTWIIVVWNSPWCVLLLLILVSNLTTNFCESNDACKILKILGLKNFYYKVKNRWLTSRVGEIKPNSSESDDASRNGTKPSTMSSRQILTWGERLESENFAIIRENNVCNNCKRERKRERKEGRKGERGRERKGKFYSVKIWICACFLL